ncbi:MAG: phosphoribosylglycinamide formyltransferase [Candidatus Aenigmarchaeota archaeon]|nr:phosphoribosylglycinamide formyltransferase [Candidatus Aenigmarchaeota archaeon]
MTYKIGWFSSGEVKSEEGRKAARELLETVLKAKNEGILDIEISFVFSNIEPGERPYGDEFFRLVNSYGLPLVTFSSDKFAPKMREKGKEELVALHGKLRYDVHTPILDKWRELYDEACLAPGYLGDYERPDLCVSIGDMTIWGKPKCEFYDCIALHPALPWGPKGTWQSVIWEIIEKRENEHGVMMLQVTEELDRGPPITYCKFPIVGGEYNTLWQGLDEKLKIRSLEQVKKEEYETEPLFVRMRKDGVEKEHQIIVYTIKLFADRVLEFRNKALYEVKTNKLVVGGYDITDVMEKGN